MSHKQMMLNFGTEDGPPAQPQPQPTEPVSMPLRAKSRTANANVNILSRNYADDMLYYSSMGNDANNSKINVVVVRL